MRQHEHKTTTNKFTNDACTTAQMNDEQEWGTTGERENLSERRTRNPKWEITQTAKTKRWNATSKQYWNTTFFNKWNIAISGLISGPSKIAKSVVRSQFWMIEHESLWFYTEFAGKRACFRFTSLAGRKLLKSTDSTI